MNNLIKSDLAVFIILGITFSGISATYAQNNFFHPGSPPPPSSGGPTSKPTTSDCNQPDQTTGTGSKNDPKKTISVRCPYTFVTEEYTTREDLPGVNFKLDFFGELKHVLSFKTFLNKDEISFYQESSASKHEQNTPLKLAIPTEAETREVIRKTVGTRGQVSTSHEMNTTQRTLDKVVVYQARDNQYSDNTGDGHSYTRAFSIYIDALDTMGFEWRDEAIQRRLKRTDC